MNQGILPPIYLLLILADYLVLMLFGAPFGTALLLRNQNTREKGIFLIFGLLLFIPYFLYMLHLGSTSIWWDVERYLAIFLLFFVIPSAYFLEKISSKGNLLPIALIMLILLFLPQYIRFHEPAIQLENGLRGMTKAAGLELKETQLEEMACCGNCAPVAFYSGINTKIFFSGENLAGWGGHALLFDNVPYQKDIAGKVYTINKTFSQKQTYASLFYFDEVP